MRWSHPALVAAYRAGRRAAEDFLRAGVRVEGPPAVRGVAFREGDDVLRERPVDTNDQPASAPGHSQRGIWP